MSAEETWDLFLALDELEPPEPAAVSTVERRELVAIEPAGGFEVRDGRILVRTTMVFRDGFGFQHRQNCLTS